MTHYIGKVLQPMSILEIILYSILGAILVAFMFKWIIWDRRKGKKQKKNVYKDEENEEE